MLLSRAQERALGEATFRQMLRQAGARNRLLPTGHAASRRLQGVAKRVVRAASDLLGEAGHSGALDGVKWSFAVVDEPSTVNAFALPSGAVVVYTGLLQVRHGVELQNRVWPYMADSAKLQRCEIRFLFSPFFIAKGGETLKKWGCNTRVSRVTNIISPLHNALRVAVSWRRRACYHRRARGGARDVPPRGGKDFLPLMHLACHLACCGYAQRGARLGAHL